MAKEIPNIYRAIKWLSMSYEEAKKRYRLREAAGEITGPQRHQLELELDFNFKSEIDSMIARVDNGELDGTVEAEASNG